MADATGAYSAPVVEGPQELVHVTMTGQTFHRSHHAQRFWTVAWTRRFAEEGLMLRPCKVCLPMAPKTEDHAARDECPYCGSLGADQPCISWGGEVMSEPHRERFRTSAKTDRGASDA